MCTAQLGAVHTVGMTNTQKNKGDRAERDAIAYLTRRYPFLTSGRARRVLGAGRKDDEGDILVFDGVSIQVKAWDAVGAALKAAAAGALTQRVNAGNKIGVGMVKVPRARGTTPKWLAVAYAHEWPGEEADWPLFRRRSTMFRWLALEKDEPGLSQATTAKERAKFLPPARAAIEERICMWVDGGQYFVVAPIEAWVTAWAGVDRPCSADTGHAQSKDEPHSS